MSKNERKRLARKLNLRSASEIDNGLPACIGLGQFQQEPKPEKANTVELNLIQGTRNQYLPFFLATFLDYTSTSDFGVSALYAGCKPRY